MQQCYDADGRTDRLQRHQRRSRTIGSEHCRQCCLRSLSSMRAQSLQQAEEELARQATASYGRQWPPSTAPPERARVPEFVDRAALTSMVQHIGVTCPPSCCKPTLTPERSRIVSTQNPRTGDPRRPHPSRRSSSARPARRRSRGQESSHSFVASPSASPLPYRARQAETVIGRRRGGRDQAKANVRASGL